MISVKLKKDDVIYLGQKEARFYSVLNDDEAVVSITHTAYMATGEFGEYEEAEELDKLVVVPFSDISLKPLYEVDIISMKRFEIENAKIEAKRIIREAKLEIQIELTNHKKELQEIKKEIENIKISFDGMIEAKEVMSHEYFLIGYGEKNVYFRVIEKSKVLSSDDWSIKISLINDELTFFPISYDGDYMYMSGYGRKGLMFKTKQDIICFLNENLTELHQYPISKIEEFEALGISKDIFKQRKEKLLLINKKAGQASLIQREIEEIKKGLR